MAVCRFCGQEFVSAQAVRAHLKGCEAYRNRPSKADTEPASLRDDSLGSASLLGNASREGNEPASGDFDPVHQLQQRITAEQLRLKLRELEEAHRELDSRTEARERERLREVEQHTQAVRAAERERETVRAREEQARQERDQKDAAQRQLKTHRREIIQDVKREAVDRWVQGIFVSGELKAQILQGIEQAMAPLPVTELLRDELIQIARGVRDKLHAQVVEAQQQVMQLTQKRQRLAEHGLDYARRELQDVEGLDLSERWRIEARVKEELEHVSGDETRAEIEEWVEEILEREGIEYDDQ